MYAPMKCISCQSYFDIIERIPLSLSCNPQHSICSICIYEQYLKQKSNLCPFPGCQMISKINPRNLPVNENIYNELQNQELKLQKLETSVTKLKNLKSELKQLYQQLSSQQVQFSQQLISLLNQSIFARANTTLLSASKSISNLNEKVLLLEYILNELKKRKQIQNLDIEENLDLKSFEEQKDKMLRGVREVEERSQQFFDALSKVILEQNQGESQGRQQQLSYQDVYSQTKFLQLQENKNTQIFSQS